jgi:hypothetical protein
MTSKKKTTRKNTLCKTDSVVFFDDDLLRNIQPFRENFPNIKSIHVTTTKPYVQILQKKTDVDYPAMYLKKYKDNRYAQELVKANNICEQCQNVTNQGISIPDLKKIIQWSSRTNKPRTILFDLDNTLTVCNLILSPDVVAKTEKDICSVEEIAQYISGTMERYDALLLMFFHLRKNGVACKVLTNNGWADKEYSGFPFFLKIMQVFDPKMTTDDVIYGQNDKVRVFKKYKEFLPAQTRKRRTYAQQLDHQCPLRLAGKAYVRCVRKSRLRPRLLSQSLSASSS